MDLPLKGITVLEFSQYLAGPYAGLRLADLGATVIKIERPGKGDACRQLATKNRWADGDSVLFHTINRNKSSIEANLKDPADLEKVKALIKTADVLTHNFRPGVMEKIGLDYGAVKQLNETLVYAQVSGYGKEGPWKDKPGQDLLAQSLSGLAWLSGNADQPPVPFGIAVADMLCGTHLAQGILAALVRRKRKGLGALVEASLIESMIDLQFETITTYLNNGQKKLNRSAISNAHALLAAPYGIYKTRDGHIAISITSLESLASALNQPRLFSKSMLEDPFNYRDEAKHQIQRIIQTKDTALWLEQLEDHNIWCSDIYDYQQLLSSAAYKSLEMELKLERNKASIQTTRCPIQLNGKKLSSTKAAPAIGESNALLEEVAS